MANIIFGTDGWRGLIGEEVNEQNIALVAQAFADYLNYTSNYDKIKVAIGFDSRKYSPEFASVMAEVLSGNGIIAYSSDKVVPTPALSHYVLAEQLHAGIMITASHNPADYNGVKFKAAYGGPFFTEETLLVEERLGKSPVVRSSENVVLTDMLESYFRKLESLIDFQLISDSGIAVLIDSMGGAGGNYLELLLRRNGCKADSLCAEPSTDFYGRSPEPIEKNLLPLKNALQSNTRYAFGAATDGDADRVGILLDTGEWLSAQFTILLLADYAARVKRSAGHIVKTSSVTDKLFAFASPDRKVFDVQVGFKYICEKMVAEDILLGCEESGGYGFKNHMPERDGLLSALTIAEMLACSGHKLLSEYYEGKRREYGEIFYDRIDFPYTKLDRNEKLPHLFALPPRAIAGFPVLQVDEFYSSRGVVNGLKFRLEGTPRWVLIRSSETEPLFRYYAEGTTVDEVVMLLSAAREMIEG